MIKESKEPSYYDVLDVSMNASPESIRSAYIRAKNTYGRDSLALYTLIDAEESKRILVQIEEAYDVLSDRERRKKYDESHGFITSNGIDSEPMIPINIKSAFVENQPQNQEEHFSQTFQPTAPMSIEDALTPIDKINSSLADNRATHVSNAAGPTSTLTKAYKVSRSYEKIPEMEEKLQKAENITGPFLKAAREYKRVAFEEMMDIIKVKKHYLLALEEDNFAKLPAAVFVRGFVIQYAKALNLTENAIADSYMKYFRSQRPGL